MEKRASAVHAHTHKRTHTQAQSWKINIIQHIEDTAWNLLRYTAGGIFMDNLRHFSGVTSRGTGLDMTRSV